MASSRLKCLMHVAWNMFTIHEIIDIHISSQTPSQKFYWELFLTVKAEEGYLGPMSEHV